MRHNFLQSCSFGLCTISTMLGVALAIGTLGCDREVHHSETVKTRSDGTRVKEETTVKEHADGTVTKEERKSVEKPVNP
jgi:hypothetical protein